MSEEVVFVPFLRGGGVYGSRFHHRRDCRQFANAMQHGAVKFGEFPRETAEMFGVGQCANCVKLDNLASLDRLIVCYSLTASSVNLWLWGQQVRMRQGQYVDPDELAPHNVPIEIRQAVGIPSPTPEDT